MNKVEVEPSKEAKVGRFYKRTKNGRFAASGSVRRASRTNENIGHGERMEQVTDSCAVAVATGKLAILSAAWLKAGYT